MSATSTSGLAVTFTSATPTVCSATGTNGATITLLATGTCTIAANQAGDATFSPAPEVRQGFAVSVAPATLTRSPATLDFGGQSMNTTAPGQTVTIANGGGSALTITALTPTTGFAVAGSTCGTLPAALNPGASCTATITFTPAAEGNATGTLTIASSSGSPTVLLTGAGERSLVTHYYRSILQRAPDDGGKAFWDGEVTRVRNLGLNVNEVWFAMAQQFYTSGEYLALNQSNEGFVTDLFNTFFNRGPDQAGLTYWQGQLDQGMPREVLLSAFMFSTEFGNFTSAVFGTPAVRAEVNVVTDFYRGLLSRLPDDGGFAFWLAKFRAAQCAGANAGNAVNAEVESISSLFATSQEYANRSRNPSQYVGDLYNAFLRRGGDLGGVQFWIDEIAQNRRTRENVRQAFVASPEFQARVVAVINQGCLQ